MTVTVFIKKILLEVDHSLIISSQMIVMRKSHDNDIDVTCLSQGVPTSSSGETNRLCMHWMAAVLTASVLSSRR